MRELAAALPAPAQHAFPALERNTHRALVWVPIVASSPKDFLCSPWLLHPTFSLTRLFYRLNSNLGSSTKSPLTKS